ncbi:ComEC/Rec2 family competence protein [Cyclobacterium marinum]|uniref:ComEC/Rec2 family competence protein n=1 Tax=Cyclobacterium marinum TaxID=104 RepID=UPI0011EF78E9|nr:ComEC/Rec2 family competence protein [Cyclobacterium marinum]MBI0399095.1 ComEC family competence protein [Cyclobacterium marinum]
MKFNEFPFVRYTIFFVAGVLLYPITKQFLGDAILAGLLSCLIGYIGITFAYNPNRRVYFKLILPLLAYFCLLFSGMYVASLRDVSFMPDHLIHFSKINSYLAEVKEVDQIKPNSRGNRLSVKAVETEDGWLPAQGEVQIYHQSALPLEPGAVIHVNGPPHIIAPPSNPAMFDYSEYMARKGIYFRHFIGQQFKLVSRPEKGSWSSVILAYRQYLEERINTYIRDPNAKQIALALLLGQKQDLEKGLREAYATAGAMHILAVSGLHVGIVYGFFFLLFKPSKMKGLKRAAYLSVIVGVIWFYAILTGLSPSVLRSATMFTFICMAQMNSRNPSIFNPLALSALLLLVYDPFLIYTVGFQLSYIALLGILLFQPIISKIWHPKSKWLRYLWDITSVGLAAQLATFPLAVHYFHVFPTYFILTNLLAIPAAFVIMSIGVPFLLFGAIPGMAQALGWLLGYTIQFLNLGIFGLQKLPFARMDGLYMDWPEMILFWALLFCLYHWIADKKRHQFIAMFVMVFMLGFYRLVVSLEMGAEEYMVIYKLKQGVVMDYSHKGQFYTIEWEVDSTEMNFNILPHRIKEMGLSPKPLAFWVKDGLCSISLPGNKELLLDADTFTPAAPQGVTLFFWEKGNWWPHQETSLHDPFSKSAIKISFNK